MFEPFLVDSTTATICLSYQLAFFCSCERAWGCERQINGGDVDDFDMDGDGLFDGDDEHGDDDRRTGNPKVENNKISLNAFTITNDHSGMTS